MTPGDPARRRFGTGVALRAPSASSRSWSNGPFSPRLRCT